MNPPACSTAQACAAVMQVLTELTGHHGALIWSNTDSTNSPTAPASQTHRRHRRRSNPSRRPHRPSAGRTRSPTGNQRGRTPGVQLPGYEGTNHQTTLRPAVARGQSHRPPAPQPTRWYQYQPRYPRGRTHRVMGANGTGKTTHGPGGLLASEGEITGRTPVMVFQNPETPIPHSLGP